MNDETMGNQQGTKNDVSDIEIGWAAGFLDGDISTDKTSPFDITANGQKISLKTLNNENESVVIKSISDSLKKYYNYYDGTHENKEQLKTIFS